MLQPSFSLIEEVTEKGYGKFIIEPLEKGYGQTLGVGLRRVLLSSIEGAAVTQVRIDGVQHQFTTLSGMKEDVVEFILNLKQLHLSLNSETETEAVAKLSVKGPGTVTAKDIDLPSTVTLTNPEQPLAVLAGNKTALNAEITIETGRGYSLAADRPTTTLGNIPVDASFSPVIKVAYKIESTRVGRRTDFDKLILEVWTNATISPREAVEKAAKILVSHFQQVYAPVVVAAQVDDRIEDRLEGEIYKLTVEELDLPTRIANALRKGGYKTVKDLTQAEKMAIAKVKNLGEKSVDVVAKALSQKGLTLKDDQPTQ